MSGGAVVNVVLSLILYPIVTRIYSTEDMAVYGIFLSVTTLIALISTALYPSGLVIPKFKIEFYALLKLSFYLGGVGVLFSLAAVFLFSDIFGWLFQWEILGLLIYIIPLGVALEIVKDIAVNWNVRNKDFTKNALSSVVNGGSMRILSIGYGKLIAASSIGLVSAQVFSNFFTIATLGVGGMIEKLKLVFRIDNHEVKRIAKKYERYPTYLLPSNILNKYTADLPIYLITAYFAPTITGAFVLSSQIIRIPINVIGSSVASVFLQKANELFHNDPEETRLFAKNTHYKILFLGTLAFGFLYAFGDITFYIVFGQEWKLAGQFASILSIFCVFKLLSGPMARVYRITGKEQYSLYVSIVLAICRTIGIFIGVLSGSYILAIYYFVAGNVIGYIFNMYLVFDSLKMESLKLVSITIFYVVLAFSLFHLLRFSLDHFLSFTNYLMPIE
jgi:O-antigen/teichoic acid export membrane protein